MITGRRLGDVICDLTVPGAPRVKARPRVTKNGVFSPRVNREHEQYLRDFFALCLSGRRAHRATATGEVRVEIEFHLPTRRRCDTDNLAKLVLDSANGVIWADDCQVASLHVEVYRGVGEAAACTRLRVQELISADALL